MTEGLTGFRLVFRRMAWRYLGVPSFMVLCSVLTYAETLTGIVYSNALGNGTYPVGRFELAVGTTVYTIEYGEPLRRYFRDETCNDIGARWQVQVTYVGGTRYAKNVTCNGDTDDDIHKPYVLVRDYIIELVSGGLHTKGLSKRYATSPQFKNLVQGQGTARLKLYSSLAHMDQCLKVISVKPSIGTRLATHCAITSQGNFVALGFDIVRSEEAEKWEIDGIIIEAQS